MAETSSRLLTLLSLLQARRDWPGFELAARLDVSTRTVRRDVERLRRLGYPVESLRGPAGGYTLRAGTAMPPLLLEDDEAIAIAVGLRTAARASVAGIEESAIRALVKLEQVLPSKLRSRVSALTAATETLPGPGPLVDAEHLTVLAGGCRDAVRVRFAYESRDGQGSRREVEPMAVVNHGRRWYLVAWDLGREDWRTFRIDRLMRPESTGVRFGPRALPAPSAVEFVSRSLSAQPQRYPARITVHAPASEVERLVPAGWGSVRPIDDETCEYLTGDHDIHWLAIRVAMIRAELEVHEPPELRDELERLAGRAQRAAAR